MAVSVAAMSQRYDRSLAILGTATNYSETVAAAGALSVIHPVSIINVNGTATTVNEVYTLGTASVEGWRKTIITGQGAATASDSLGTLSIELANPVGATASTNNIMSMEYPGCAELVWVNDRWIAFGSLHQGVAAAVTTATI